MHPVGYFLSIIYVLCSIALILHFIKSRDKVTLFNFGYTIFLALACFYAGLFYSHDLLQIPSFFGWGAVFQSFLSSFILLTTVFLIDPGIKWKTWYFLAFFPPVILLVQIIQLYFLPHEVKIAYIQSSFEIGAFEYNHSWFPVQWNFLWGLLVYLIITRQCMQKMDIKKIIQNKADIKPFQPLLFVVLLTAFVTMLTWSIYFILRLLNYNHYSNKMLYFLIIDVSFIFLFFTLSPILLRLKILKRTFEKNLTRTYFKSKIANLNILEVENKLQYLIYSEKIFRNEEITLGMLAKKTGIKKEQLSEYLNVRIGKTFLEYIHFYRIEDAKQMLMSNYDINSSNIAFEVGFNSMSTFYKTFKQITGKTPAQYREEFIKNSMEPMENIA